MTRTNEATTCHGLLEFEGIGAGTTGRGFSADLAQQGRVVQWSQPEPQHWRAWPTAEGASTATGV